MNIFTIYSMSNSPYQEWQAELLDWSFVHSGQPGQLIRLCSEDPYHLERGYSFSTVAKTICTPDYSKIDWPYFQVWHWNVPIFPFKRRVYWPVMNKPGTLKHLFENFTFQATDTLVFLDPDMVFSKPWTPVFDPGTVFGQKWFGYSKPYCERSSSHPELCPETDNDCVMYPFAIKAGDLKKMVTDIEHFTLEGYKIALSNGVSGHWMSDMPAFQTAMTKHELVMYPHDNIGLCNNWENRNDPDAPILHYCQPMLDHNGNRIWWKWNYVPWETPPCLNRATNRVDREVLDMLRRKVKEAQACNVQTSTT